MHVSGQAEAGVALQAKKISAADRQVIEQTWGKLTCRAQSSTITLDGAGVTVRTGATVSVDAGQVEVTAGSVAVKTGTATFSGVVQCNTLVATTVNASVYSPGVGNIW